MPSPKPTGLFIVILFFISQLAYGQVSNHHSFYLYEDSAKKLTAAQALGLYQQQKFTQQVKEEANVGFTRSVFWLAFENDRDLPADSLLLYIGHHHINRIHFFFAGDSSIKQQWLTGDYYPFSQRPVLATGFYFPVNKKGVYLARIDKSNESLQMSFHLVSRIGAISTEANNKIIMSIFTGMILLLVIFGIYLFVISGDSIYVFYILYIASGWLWVLANAGYGFQYLWPDLPWFASKARPVFALAPMAFSLLFLGSYIGGIRTRGMRTILLVTSFILLSFIIIIFTFNEEGYQNKWWFYIQYCIPLISLFYVLLIMAILITASLRRNKLAIFYLAAVLVLLISAILQVSFSLGKINRFGVLFSDFGMAFGYVMESIILTAGLVYRFNQYRLEKERLLVERNKSQQENTRILIEVQEAERSQVANQLHDVAGSLLSAAKLNLSSLREKDLLLNEQSKSHLAKTEEAVSLVSEMVRNLSHALSPVMLEQVGFKTSLEKIIAIVNASGKIKVQLLVTGFEKYEPQFHTHYNALYGIIYELLNNTVKHAGAKNALVQVTEHEDCFTLIVEDDGKGIDPNQPETKNYLGIAGIRSKIHYFGGLVAFDMNKPSGLIVTIEIPVIRSNEQSSTG
ncbi:MAG: 7TM diverse intracellular signaling domain-containing protein [Chitinophagaceae bacterium]